ncbi:MAG: ABC transporter permease [Chloroflexota bacterium]
MSDISSASGELSPSATVVSYAEPKRARRSSNLTITSVLLVIVGVASLIITEQILTGWLALGERANIPRSNLNPIELTVAAGCLLWGMVTLRTALGFFTHERVPTIRDYFEGTHSRMAPGILLTIALLGVIGVVSLVLAEQVLTGWLPLGERINIPRSHLNTAEILAIIGGTLWGVVTLRTVYGLWRRDHRAWAWAQWVVLLTAVIGMSALLSGMFDLHTLVPRGGSIFDNLPGVQELTAPGLLIFLSCVAVYRYITIDVELSAAQALRNTLAKSPGAGGIIGFIALFIVFSLASDLFLEPRSLAGIVTTNITRGIVAIGVTFLMISGEFDLSVGSTYGAGALIFLLMMTEGVFGITTSVIPAAIIALIFAGILGLINGLILIWTGIPSFIVTLGTLLAYRAILLVVVADGRILRYADYRLPPPYIHFSHWLIAAGALALAAVIAYMGYRLIPSAWRGFRSEVAGYRDDPRDMRDFYLAMAFVRFVLTAVAVLGAIFLLLQAAYYNILSAQVEPVFEISFFELMNGQFHFVPRDVNLRSGVMWWFILVVIFQFILTQTRYGNHVLAVGGNPGAARAQGINVNRVKVTNFVISAMLACLAGIINVSRLANVDPLMGNGLELEVIAASVIGGALLSGGYGSIIGAFLGVLIFGMLQTGLVLVGVDSRAFSGVIGVIIIVAVVINTAVRRARK